MEVTVCWFQAQALRASCFCVTVKKYHPTAGKLRQLVGGSGGPANEDAYAGWGDQVCRRVHSVSRVRERAVFGAIGGVVAVAAVPLALGALGFTGAGIAASSVAAKMMSAAAVANGGGVAAGSLVATLQSVGAAGLSTSSNILLGTTGSALGALMGGSTKKPPHTTKPSSGDEDSAEEAEEGDLAEEAENVPKVKPPNPLLRSKKHEK
ncbi:PREDICTED: interferon alpha-inducible protein 27-like protein 2 [Chrysochloris asiatica]|uniref:Interferon alpha-inducible protein 27-like protein 2 n=1 Tax=Chrysochloris asiatica TaxID=185453 RepID=A0A9B0TBM8_CHRAS|nr:PREDICTED: interferon alpha-inducible protein 27-like protein 2 [Chrysochloris asiatica]